MTRLEADARRWLRRDAAYCAVAGLIMLVLAEPIGRLFDVPFAAVVGIGAATLVWA